MLKMFGYIRLRIFEKQLVILKLTENLEQLMMSLTKLYLFHNSDCTAEWRKDAWRALRMVIKPSYNKKWPSYKFIYEAITGYADQTRLTVEVVLDDDNCAHNIKRSDLQELEAKIYDYLDWLAHELSENGIVTASQVTTKLKSIGL